MLGTTLSFILLPETERFNVHASKMDELISSLQCRVRGHTSLRSLYFCMTGFLDGLYVFALLVSWCLYVLRGCVKVSDASIFDLSGVALHVCRVGETAAT